MWRQLSRTGGRAGAEDAPEVRRVLERGVEVDEVRDADGQDGRCSRAAGCGRRRARGGGGVLHGAPGGRAELDERVEVGRAARARGRGRRGGRAGEQHASSPSRSAGRGGAAAHAHDAPREGRCRGAVLWRRHRPKQPTRMPAHPGEGRGACGAIPHSARPDAGSAVGSGRGRGAISALGASPMRWKGGVLLGARPLLKGMGAIFDVVACIASAAARPDLARAVACGGRGP